MRSPRLLVSLAIPALTAITSAASAAQTPEFTLVIRNHRFEPAELKVPAGQRVKLIVNNQDSSPEEFESHGLNREKVVPGRAKATVFIGPLTPGRYTFFGEYNEKTAQGTVVVD